MKNLINSAGRFKVLLFLLCFSFASALSFTASADPVDTTHVAITAPVQGNDNAPVFTSAPNLSAPEVMDAVDTLQVIAEEIQGPEVKAALQDVAAKYEALKEAKTPSDWVNGITALIASIALVLGLVLPKIVRALRGTGH